MFLIIVVSRAATLELKVEIRVRRPPSRSSFCPVVMQRPRTHVDHKINGQCGDGNQAAVQENSHCTVVLQLEPCSSPALAEHAVAFDLEVRYESLKTCQVAFATSESTTRRFASASS